MFARAAYSLAGIAVLLSSFWATWVVLDRWAVNPTSSPVLVTDAMPRNTTIPVSEPPATEAASLDEIPKLTASGLAWVGIAGLNVQVAHEVSAVPNQPALRLIAIPTDGVHTLAVQVTGLKNQLYRITAWVKPLAGHGFAIGAGDQATENPNSASANFDLVRNRLVSGYRSRSDIGLGPGDWRKVWVDVSTSTHLLVVNFYIAKGSESTFKGDGMVGVTLGGITVEPLPRSNVGLIAATSVGTLFFVWVAWFFWDQRSRQRSSSVGGSRT
jgi:hypothetical protein